MTGTRSLPAGVARIVVLVAGLALAASASCSKKSDAPSKPQKTAPGAADGSASPPGTHMGVGQPPGMGQPERRIPRPKAKRVKRITPAQAQALLSKVAQAAKSRKADCKRIMRAVNVAAAVVGPTTKENQRAFLAASLCGERTGNYRMMLWAAAALAKADPRTRQLGIIARAWMHLKQPGRALAELKAANKKYPRAPGVLFAAMLLADNQKAWKRLTKLAAPTTKALVGSRFRAMGWQAQLLEAKGWIHLAKMKKVGQALKKAVKLGAPAQVMTQVRKRLIPVRATKVYVDPDVPQEIYLGTYHLYGKAKVIGEILSVEIANLTGKDRSFKLQVEIPGVTDLVTKTVNVLAKGNETIKLTPPLKAAFNPKALQAERTAQVNIKVSAGAKVVYEETIPTKLFPRDQLPLAHNAFIPAWITPQSPAVEALLTAAKKRAPGKGLPGKLGPTLPQIKALYDELKARGMSYVLVTNFGLSHAQHARLPAQTIQSTNALCLDGALLFAALAEKLGLRPVLVRVPGHIFFGWHAEAADRAPPGTIYFLETTFVGSTDFKTAARAGTKQFLQQKRLGGFKTGQAQMIDIIELRKLGITPQPWG